MRLKHVFLSVRQRIDVNVTDPRLTWYRKKESGVLLEHLSGSNYFHLFRDADDYLLPPLPSPPLSFPFPSIRVTETTPHETVRQVFSPPEAKMVFSLPCWRQFLGFSAPRRPVPRGVPPLVMKPLRASRTLTSPPFFPFLPVFLLPFFLSCFSPFFLPFQSSCLIFFVPFLTFYIISFPSLPVFVEKNRHIENFNYIKLHQGLMIVVSLPVAHAREHMSSGIRRFIRVEMR